MGGNQLEIDELYVAVAKTGAPIRDPGGSQEQRRETGKAAVDSGMPRSAQSDSQA